MIRGQDETRGRIERERVVRLAMIGGRGRVQRGYQQFATAPRRGWWPGTGGRHRGLVRLGV
jgi:hypothetical protein